MDGAAPSCVHPRKSRLEGGLVIRSRLRLTAAVALAAWFLALPRPAAPQAESGEDIRYRLRTSVDLVLVPVTVKDSDNNLVADLQRENFRLFEDGEEQPIRHFSVDPFPLSALLLVDAGLDPRQYQTVQESLSVFLSAIGPYDEFALYAFDTYPRQILDFTRDPDTLGVAIQSLARGPSRTAPASGGMTGGPMTAGPRINTVPIAPGVSDPVSQSPKSVKAIHDALFAAAVKLRDREPGHRRVIFIISDGRNSRLNVRTYDETKDLLLTEEISVYAVGVGSARLALGTTVLSDYVGATGGDFYAPLKMESLARTYMRVVEQARYQYTLVYAIQPAPVSRQYRSIRVEVNRPRVTVRARDGYFVGAPEH
jgi:VWFA-related protein